ncbi:MAG: DUF3445 domain-containing protein [Acetobacteraceae bacterium]
MTMLPLPPETVHLPFEPGPYRMAMGLTTAAEPDWFEFDALYLTEMRERHRLLAAQRAEVFAALPCSAAARHETLQMMADHLPLHRPSWFARDGANLVNQLTGETWNLAKPSRDPLEIAGLLVQEDLCIIQVQDSVPHFTAAVLCFPSRWRLGEKIGRPLADVHGPVPIYPDRLSRPVDRFMRHIRAGHIATRLNWSILDDPTLFQPTGKWRDGDNARVTAANAGETLYLRVERQTLRRLPVSDAVLFGIRVHSYPLGRVVASPALAGRLAEAVRALPSDIVHYKSLRPIRDALLGWLDAHAVITTR